ncbi:MAG: hypothetical protein HY376_03535 [Candidatus Blackburnbacteria bacterium]|nr:hypothetical protein [Candidatus Blackburnbacteria bacterium]
MTLVKTRPIGLKGATCSAGITIPKEFKVVVGEYFLANIEKNGTIILVPAKVVAR